MAQDRLQIIHSLLSHHLPKRRERERPKSSFSSDIQATQSRQIGLGPNGSNKKLPCVQTLLIGTIAANRDKFRAPVALRSFHTIRRSSRMRPASEAGQ